MKLIVALAALLTAAPCIPQTLPPNSTLWSDAAPPERYRGPARVTVSFSATVQADCIALGAPSPPAGMYIAACHKDGLIVMPIPEGDDRYSHLMQHELGHQLGWPATHGD